MGASVLPDGRKNENPRRRLKLVRQRAPPDVLLETYLARLEARCRAVLGLTLAALRPIDPRAAFEARLSVDTAFEELILGSLSRGVHKTRFRLFHAPSKNTNPFSPDDFATVTAVHEPRPPTRTEVPMGVWIDFADLRRRVSLEDILLRMYGVTNLTREGSKLAGPCPVHGGDSPRAFHADLSKNVWHCFSKCQGGGNQLDFVAKKEKLSVRDAALKLLAAFPPGEAGANGAASVPPTNDTAPVSPPPATAHAASGSGPRKASKVKAEEDEGTVNAPLTFRLQLRDDHPHLLGERKLKPETIAEFGVGYCAQGILRGMIAIPVHDEDGDLVAYVGRRLKPADIREHGKYKLPKGFKKERILYNFHRAKGSMGDQGLVVVAGFFAALKLHEAGFPNVVATMGVEVSPHQAALLTTAKELVVLFPGADAGYASAQKLREQVGGTIPVRVVRLPQGLKPEDCPVKLLRWQVNGMRALDLLEVAFTPNTR